MTAGTKKGADDTATALVFSPSTVIGLDYEYVNSRHARHVQIASTYR